MTVSTTSAGAGPGGALVVAAAALLYLGYLRIIGLEDLISSAIPPPTTGIIPPPSVGKIPTTVPTPPDPTMRLPVGQLSDGTFTSPIDVGGGPGPRQPPRTPDEDPSYDREKIPRGEPGGASRPWGAVCAALGLGGIGLGFVVRAETSDTGLNYPVAGGVFGLGLCALAYASRL